MFSMHTEHLANISKSVTKNATFPRTGGLPCLITQQLHVCCISYSFGGLIFCISATPHLGTSFPLFHAVVPCLRSPWIILHSSRDTAFSPAVAVCLFVFMKPTVKSLTQINNLSGGRVELLRPGAAVCY